MCNVICDYKFGANCKYVETEREKYADMDRKKIIFITTSKFSLLMTLYRTRHLSSFVMIYNTLHIIIPKVGKIT